MSPTERTIPPVGEEIHIPGPSLDPVLLAVGITVTLLGVTLGWVLLVVGGLLTIGVLIHWVKEARAEFEHLPMGEHSAVQDTAGDDPPHPA
jgi:hypothetical protein